MAELLDLTMQHLSPLPVSGNLVLKPTTSTTFTIPATARFMMVHYLVGGGGGGGGITSQTCAGGGGGGGQVIKDKLVVVSAFAGMTLSVTLGAGGAGGGNEHYGNILSAGGEGGDSHLVANAVTLATALGGGRGLACFDQDFASTTKATTGGVGWRDSGDKTVAGAGGGGAGGDAPAFMQDSSMLVCAAAGRARAGGIGACFMVQNGTNTRAGSGGPGIDGFGGGGVGGSNGNGYWYKIAGSHGAGSSGTQTGGADSAHANSGAGGAGGNRWNNQTVFGGSPGAAGYAEFSFWG